MALIFTLIVTIYYFLVSRFAKRGPGVLLKILLYLYLSLGIAGSVIELTGISPPIYGPNYWSAAFLAICVLVSISGFYGFRSASLSQVIGSIRGQGIIESFLIVTQLGATAFFLPVAIQNLSGDVALNRMDATLVADQLADSGVLNTLASAACPLFVASLLLAFIRLSQPATRDTWWRVGLLVAASLSYIVYILAYVGRDGIIYWSMTALAIFLMFRSHLNARARFYIVGAISGVGIILVVPFLIITLARFGQGSSASLLDYFGGEIQNFGDYSTIFRPRTNGMQNFPLFYQWYCDLASIRCDSWEVVRPNVFSIYLAQGKEPWLFATFISDWVADFGYLGVLVVVLVLFALCAVMCRAGHGKTAMTLPRLLLIMFLFLVPYWGVFYFRFGISNLYIIVNVVFIVLVWLAQVFLPPARQIWPASIRAGALQPFDFKINLSPRSPHAPTPYSTLSGGSRITPGSGPNL